ncbi:LysR family transcriptional regulator [Methylobacterium organophilum]|uniref:LysR family transcriptional regulator n=1 Tax=Methylobacterium organophilum TaxID=410 RepID=UPI001F147949|nr:LysR family transcriptional regulator [Methylobacterium organophilum]UMY16028.1 LysR family transcriptional regulator [Methylobacterium organophilum]
MRPRRFLPSVSQLSAFESVLRTGSTAAAARDMNLAQGTVSRLVQSLEGQLGRALFVRRNQRLVATPAALAYGREVSRALDILQRASVDLASNPDGGALSLAILPAFGTRWLSPRLSRFLVKHPGVSIHLGTRLKRFDFDAEAFDAAIHFGHDDWPETERMELFKEGLTACVAPDLLARTPIQCLEDMMKLPLLRIETRPTAWRTWFEAQGAPPPAITGMLFDQFAPMTQAAIYGLGVALLPHYLAEAEIAEGRLVPLFRQAVPGSGSYWLVWPRSRPPSPALIALLEWLRSEIGAQT